MADVLQTEDKVEEFLEYLEDWTPAVGVPLLSLSLMTRADTRRSNHILPAASRVCLPRLTHVSQERTAHTDLLITSCRRRIVCLAAQKFVSEIANDALQYSKLRQQSSSSRQDTKDSGAKDKQFVLTLDDLSQSLKDYGVNITKPQYFADSVEVDTSEESSSQGAAAGSTHASKRAKTSKRSHTSRSKR